MAQGTIPQSTNIDSILQEQHSFPPPPQFSQQAAIESMGEYEKMYKESIEDPEKFWAAIAKDLHWFKPWKTVLEWKAPWAKWFSGGEMNLSYNCLDFQIQKGKGSKTALTWEGEPSGEIRKLTYQELLAEVSKFANVLKKMGVKK